MEKEKERAAGVMENKKVEFKLLHVGINCVDGTEAKKTAEQFSQAMGFDISENPSSLFAGTSVEIMKKPYLGRLGHLAYGVEDIEEALNYLEERGLKRDMSTAVYREDNSLSVVYLEGEIGGFAIHLKQL